MSKTAIEIENLSKKYRLGVIGYGTIKEDLASFFAKVKGKEDPNAKIGERGRIGQKGEFWALQEINFIIEQGERIGIIGKNGAGKSTLLKILSRITAPTTGSIKVKGRIASLLEVGTGFHPELTGRENIFLNGAILGMKRNEIRKKFDEIVDFSGVKDFVDTPVKRYSSGMYVRLAFSVAAHLEADIMVVDEVLAVGDAEFQRKCVSEMERLSTEKGRTIIFVSHTMSAISRMCTKAILLNEGRIASFGNTQEQIRKYLEINTSNDAQVAYEVENAGRAYFERISLMNKDLMTNEFSIGEDVTLKLALCVPETEPEEIMVAFQIESSDGVKIANVIDKDSQFNFGNRKGQLNVTIELRDIRLYPDSYYLSFWIGDKRSYTIQHKMNVLKLIVSGGGRLTQRDLPRSAGIFFFTPEWHSV